MSVQNFDLFGNPIITNPLLKEKFMEPPFSILNGRGGDWQKRKRQWKSTGIKSELGRDAECVPGAFGKVDPKTGLDQYGRKPMSGTSIFDSSLCELMYRWFCPEGGHILDPFAGGSVRGIVAGYLNYNYTGIELREEQVASNREQADKILGADQALIQWVNGDSNVELENLAPEYDMVFSCPPYHDLEVYSDNPADLSTMTYDGFMEMYRSIIRKAIAKLKPNRFAVFVVGDIRDKKTGFYRNFNGDTKSAFMDAGAGLYNELKLLQPLGTAMLRADKIFTASRKCVKVHEDVLVFYKGDPKKIKLNFKPLKK